jgi:hypothetical protein
MNPITISNPKIIKYFEQHTEIDPESCFLVFIEILNNFGDNIFEKMSTSVNKQILDGITENNHFLRNINENISKINTEVSNALFIKMVEIKKDYMEDIKNILNTNTNERISTLIEKNNSQLIDKTSLIINDIFPKNNLQLTQTIQDKMVLFHNLLKEETLKFSKSFDEGKHVREHLESFEKNFTTIFNGLQSNLQKPLHMYINNSEERINKNISNITDITKENMLIQTKVFGELNEFLNKYRASSHKGNFHENQLNQVLNSMFSTAEIINTTSQKSAGDFLMKRLGKPNIMFENKDYTDNVYNSEIAKFIYDSENIKTHGIFLSQHSGIAGKSNYQIDYHKGNILVYVHNVDYSREKIQIAVDIIDHLSVKIEEFVEDDDNTISREVLDEINTEYQEFAIRKDALIGMAKEYSKKSIQQLEELKFPSLEKYLSLHFASALKTTKLNYQYTCDICNKYVSTNKKSLSAHQRGCKNQGKK